MQYLKITLLESRIDQFCKSSAELLTGIQTKYKCAADSHLKKKRRPKEIIVIPDLDTDFHDNAPLEDMN